MVSPTRYNLMDKICGQMCLMQHLKLTMSSLPKYTPASGEVCLIQPYVIKLCDLRINLSDILDRCTPECRNKSLIIIIAYRQDHILLQS